MEIAVSGQAAEAALSLALGAAVGIIYDLLRAIRRRLSGKAVTAIADGLFWIICAIGLFLLGFGVGHGRQRIFMTVLAFLGAVLYFLTASRIIFAFWMLVTGGIGIILKFLLAPLGIIKKFLRKILGILKKIFSSWGKWYKIQGKKNEQKRANTSRTLGGSNGAPQTYRYTYESYNSDTANIRSTVPHKTALTNRQRRGREGSTATAGSGRQRRK
jgi:hypothetical protein